MSTALGHDWAMVLRRQAARTADGQPTGRYTDAFEVICRDCGDDPRWAYRNLPHRLQRIRGPYWMEAGVAAYEAHFEWHESSGAVG
jgi:hypothetical protein